MTKTAITYGGALYDLAYDEGITARIFQDLNLFCQMIDGLPEYEKMLQEPSISKDERKALLQDVWGETMHPYSLNFLKILCDNGTLRLVKECAEQFKIRYYADEGIAEATAYVAVPLSDELKEKLIYKLEAKTGKHVILTVVEDKSLIGGIRLMMNGVEFDGSVKHHLGEIQKLLRETSF